MAIISISRETGSLGDEITKLAAEKLGYSLATKYDIEKRILTLGLPEKILKKFDDRKLSFFESFSRNREMYYNYLRSAVLNTAASNNVIIVGRGASEIFKDIENHISIRIIAGLNKKIERLSDQVRISHKSAKKQIIHDAVHQHGFYKCYYGVDIYLHPCFDFYLNTSNMTDLNRASDIIAGLVRSGISEADEVSGMKHVKELLISQSIVNILIFDYKMDINNLSASISDNNITLHGVTAQAATIRRAVQLVECEFSNYTVKNEIKAVQDSYYRN